MAGTSHATSEIWFELLSGIEPSFAIIEKSQSFPSRQILKGLQLGKIYIFPTPLFPFPPLTYPPTQNQNIRLSLWVGSAWRIYVSWPADISMRIVVTMGKINLLNLYVRCNLSSVKWGLDIPPYCSLPSSSQAPCNHSHACPLILASNRYFLQYHLNRHIHVQSTWALHGVTQHSHCARMREHQENSLFRVMLSPLVFALHYTISHIECVPLIQFVSMESLISGRIEVGIHFALFLFGPPTWLNSSAKK